MHCQIYVNIYHKTAHFFSFLISETFIKYIIKNVFFYICKKYIYNQRKEIQICGFYYFFPQIFDIGDQLGTTLL